MIGHKSAPKSQRRFLCCALLHIISITMGSLAQNTQPLTSTVDRDGEHVVSLQNLGGEYRGNEVDRDLIKSASKEVGSKM
jgi:hypothetical protein